MNRVPCVLRAAFACAAALCILAAAPAARAQTFTFGTQEEVKQVIWKATAAAGFTLATGNSSVITITGGLNASRNDGTNKLQLDVSYLYAVSSVPELLATNDTNGNGIVDTGDKVTEKSTTSGNQLLGKLRYDRFFTKNNSGYVSGYGGFDRPASKVMIAGGQIGYARQILGTKRNVLSAEAGYDINYTYFDDPPKADPNFEAEVIIHSGRVFLGYNLTINEAANLLVSVEALVNFNSPVIGDRKVGVGEATKVNGKLAFTTKITKYIGLRVAFTARYDNAPGLSSRLKFAADNPDRYNQKLDTLTDVSIVVNFL